MAKRHVEQESDRVLLWPELWLGPVDVKSVLTDVCTAAQRYLGMPVEHAALLTLWISLTYTQEPDRIYPPLVIPLPNKNQRTRLVGFLRYVVARPLLAFNIAESVVFPVIEELAPLTLLIDEDEALAMWGKEILDKVLKTSPCPLMFTCKGKLPAVIDKDWMVEIKLDPRRPQQGDRLDGEVKQILKEAARKLYTAATVGCKGPHAHLEHIDKGPHARPDKGPHAHLEHIDWDNY